MNRIIEDLITDDELSDSDAAFNEQCVHAYFALSDFDRAVYNAVTAHEAGHIAVLLALRVEVYGVCLTALLDDERSPLQKKGQIFSGHNGGPRNMADLGPFVATGFAGYFAERRFLRDRSPSYETRAESAMGARTDFAAIMGANPLSNSPMDLALWNSFVLHWARISYSIVRDGWDWVNAFIEALEDCPHMPRDEIQLNDVKYIERLGRSIVRKHNKGWKPPIEIVRAMRARSRAKALNARESDTVGSQIST